MNAAGLSEEEFVKYLDVDWFHEDALIRSITRYYNGILKSGRTLFEAFCDNDTGFKERFFDLIKEKVGSKRIMSELKDQRYCELRQKISESFGYASFEDFEAALEKK